MDPLRTSKLASQAIQTPIIEEQKVQEKSLLDNPKVSQRLNDFCKDCCPGVSQENMQKYILSGESLEREIANTPSENMSHLIEQYKGKPEAVRDLMWLLTAKTANYNQLYTSGSMRLDDPGGKVEAFIRGCGEKKVYSRISSHMKETVKLTGEPQNGLDLRNLDMPAGKRTLLFARQPDGTLFLKMESRGCPPFWTKPFRNISNFNEYALHATEFVKTRFKKDGYQIKEARKEHVSAETKEAFAKLMNILTSNNKEKGSTLIKEGQTHGVSRMDNILKKTLESTDSDIITEARRNANIIAQFRKDHLSAIEHAKERNYQGEVKGSEVVLPALGT